MPAAFLHTYRDEKKFLPYVKGWLQWQKSGAAIFRKNLAALAEGGVMLAAGTDSGNMGTFHGYSLHRELELMVDSGMGNEAALRTATTNPCRFLGRECGLKAGAVADLLVVDRSPLVDISHTRQIAYVIYKGRVVDRRALREEILKAPVMVKGAGAGGINVPSCHGH